MAGTARAAEQFRASLLRHMLEQATSIVIVAEAAGEPAGFAELSRDGGAPPLPVVARAAIRGMGVAGALGAAWRSTARLRVELKAPDGGVHLFELQVAPTHRNRGIGAFLLGRVDDYALGQRAQHISLTTATDNPARRLYERSGYSVAEQKTNERYRRITGSDGRVLMIKPVPRQGARQSY